MAATTRRSSSSKVASVEQVPAYFEYKAVNGGEGICCAHGCRAKLKHDVWIVFALSGESRPRDGLKLLTSLCDRHAAALPYGDAKDA